MSNFQYKDYSEWILSKDISEQKDYWINELSGELPVLNMPLDFERPRKKSFRGDTCVMKTGEELAEKIKRVAKNTETTEYMIFLSAAMIALSKYSGQEDILIGSPISARTHKDTEEMLGMFANTLVMRGQPKKEKTYEQFLYEVKDTCFKAYENQEYPFEDIVRELNVVRDISRNPLFDVMFVLQNNESFEFNLDGAEFEFVEDHRKVSKFDLTIKILISDNDYDVVLDYCTDLFTHQTMEWFNSHYIKILDEITGDLKRKIEDVDAVTETEYQMILESFNDTSRDYPRNKTLVEVFEAQVEKTPDNVALVYEDATMTYAELNARSNQLARKLREIGVKRADYVALMTERSMEMIIGVFGILKAGAAYVPIDVSYPRDRIKYMISDCRSSVILTDNPMEPVFFGIGANVIDLKNLKLDDVSSENLKVDRKPDDLAYLIYTSGTTGRPKGVMVEDRGVVNLKCFFGEMLEITEEDCVMLFANLVFDASVSEIVMALLNGARLYIPTKDDIMHPQKVEKIINEKIDIVTLPPHYASQIEINNIKALLTAGSESNEELLKKNVQKYINAYGPSEATVCTSYWKKDKYTGRIPVGRPIDNAKVLILDDKRLCGIGIPGEICIAGEGVARGYLNQSELTAEKFTTCPYVEGNIYRTGDIGRWLPDGNIEFFGRQDNQVKIRGYRIELGEVENIIRKIDYVDDCVAIVEKDENGELLILSYIVSANEIDESEFRVRLQVDLPEYMIPSRIIKIEEIPLTINGKVDRKKLLEIETECVKKYQAPRNATERIVCNAFEEVLNVERVGIYDSFFDLGGHSLKVIRLINMMQSKLNVKITINDIFTSPTVIALCEKLDKKIDSTYNPLPMVSDQDYYPMSSTQKRLFMVDKIGGQSTAYNIPLFFKLKGEISIEKIESVLQKLIERHDILRTEFCEINGELLQKIKCDAKEDFVYFESKDSCDENIIRDFIKPFELGQAPLFRVALVKKEEHYLLMFDTHHIISDAISMGIFMKEFAALYNAEELKPLKYQYKNYSKWMAEKDLSSQKEFWVNEFSDEIPVLDLPLDSPRSVMQSFRGSREWIALSKELTSKIKALSKRTETTEFMVFLSAAMIMLSKYSRQEDIVIGTGVSCRLHEDIYDMLGMFVNTLAIRAQPTSTKSYREFLQEIYEKCIAVYENQEYPFEDLLESIDVSRDMSRNPLFDVMLMMQNHDKTKIELKDVELENVIATDEVSKFDLSFIVAEGMEVFEISLRYCSALFSQTTIKRMLNHFEVILTRITDEIDMKLYELEMITDSEKDQIQNNFNEYDRSLDIDITIVDIFEEQVKSNPDKVALVYDDIQLSYGELNKRANQVARKLIDLGVKPNDFVAIIAERSIEMIVAIYGVLKSGGAYVPIDPDYPDRRKEYMLNDCAPKAIIKFNAEVNGKHVPVIDLKDECVFSGLSSNIGKINTPNDLIYCIYTSGTTGDPKGVMIEHRNVKGLFFNERPLFDFNQSDVWLSFHSYCFDFSVWEIFGASLFGGKLIIPKKSDVLDGYKVLSIIENYQVTVLNQVPSAFYYLSDLGLNEKFGIRYLIFGGEALEPTLLKKWYEKNKNTKIINMYGITETTVHVTFKEIGELDIEQGISDIGNALPTSNIFICDHGNHCGIGVPGEICVTGEGLARGYLNNPKLTEQKFVNNPFGKGRMYRTGDLGRWLPNGSIEYLGRLDNQVKIRGYRIELGEIESKIRDIDSVKNCVAVVKKDASGNYAINAYIVSDEEIAIDDFKSILRESLPDYMVPTYIMQLEKIPVTRDGKVNKKALPDITFNREKEFLAPTGEKEKKVADAFFDILRVEKIGRHDNFFELGGDSIKAIRIVSKLRELGLDTSVRDIMLKGSVSEIAKSAVSASIVEYTQGEVTGKVLPIPIIKHFTSMEYGDPSHFNLSMVVKVEVCSKQFVVNALEKIVSHHDILRSVYTDGTLEIREYKEAEHYDLYWYDLSDNIAFRKVIETECNNVQGSIDLTNGPLLKVLSFNTCEGQFIVFIIHHLLVDGISLRIISEDMMTLIDQQKQNFELKLPAKTASFIEWGKALEEHKRSQTLADEKNYWQKKLQNAKNGRIDRDGEIAEKGIRGTGGFTLSEEETKMLLMKSNKAYNTEINDLLLSAISMTMKSLKNMDNVALVLEGHGREDVDRSIAIDRTVGWFTSMYPIVLNCYENVQDSIINTKEMLKKVPNKGLGFGLLHPYGSIEADIYFHYIGEFVRNDSDEVTNVSSGNNISSLNRMFMPINVFGIVERNMLEFSVSYEKDKYSDTLIDEFLKTFKSSLSRIIEICVEQDETVYTASDYGSTDLETDEFDEISELFSS